MQNYYFTLNYLQITHQGIVSSDGRASFATLIYGNDGVKAINDLQDLKVIGFDAGDRVNSATVMSSGLSSLQTLKPVNIFRIDGKNSILLIVLYLYDDYTLQVIVSLQPILVKSVA